MELPEPNVDVMVTYKKTFFEGPYGDRIEKRIVTKRGFYSKLFDNFSIPPKYKYFNGILLPDGFGGDHLPVNKIISWKHC